MKDNDKKPRRVILTVEELLAEKEQMLAEALAHYHAERARLGLPEHIEEIEPQFYFPDEKEPVE